MKRIIALIMTALMLLTSLCAITVSADSDAIEELNLFGIVPKSINKSNLGDDATREELAYLASRLISGFAKEPMDTRFSDVTADNQYSGYIEHMASLGVINGKGDGIFDPQGTVKPEMAAKVFINLLGYESFGEFEGGYPQGYMNFAADLGIAQYLVASANGNLTKGALLDVCRYVLVTGFNKPQFYTAEGETQIVMTNDKSSLLGSTLKVSVYVGNVVAINPKSNTITLDITKNKYDTNYELLEDGQYKFDLAEGIDCYEYEFLPVTAWVTEDDEIIKMTPAKGTEVKYGYIDSVNGKLSNDQNPVSNIDVLTILDDEEEYEVASDAKMRFNNKATTANVSLIGKFAKIIIADGEVTFIEAWDMTEGGLLTEIRDEVLTYVKGTQKTAYLKEFNEFDLKRVFINNKPSDVSFLKTKTVFDYFVDGETIIIVNSEKQIIDTFYTKGSQGLEIGNAYYLTGDNVYFSENGTDYKANNYDAFLGKDVTAYIGPDGRVRYVAPDNGDKIASNKIYATVKGYDTDVFGEEISIEFFTFVGSVIDKKIYKMTNKTSFGDGVTKEDVLSKASDVDDSNIFMIEVTEEGIIKSIEKPMLYSGFSGNPKGTINHIIDAMYPMLYIQRENETVAKRLYFDKSVSTIVAIYEKDGAFSATTLNWDDNLRGRGDLVTPLQVTVFGDESKASSPSLIFISGDISALSTASKGSYGIVVDKTYGLKEDGTKCTVLHVLEGGEKPVEYRVSNEIAADIPSNALISYASYKYAAGQQGEADDIMLRTIKSGGATHTAIDLTADASAWPEEASITSAGFHKAKAEAIDNVRMLTTDDFAAYVDPATSSKLLSVEYNPNNPTKRFEGIELTDIVYGDEVYYLSDDYGLLKIVIKIG